MNNIGDFYIRRKCYLDNLKRKQIDNNITNRICDILSSDAIELLESQIENIRENKPDNYTYCDSISDRISRFLEENEK